MIIFSFYVFLIILMPKVEAYFTLEKFAKEQKVIISDEEIKDKWIYLLLKDAVCYFEGIKFADVAQIKVYPLFFFNYINIQNIVIDKDLSKFFPQNIFNISGYYHIFNPLNITLSGSGDFGEAKGVLNLKDKTIKIIITPSEELNKSSIKSKLKQEEDKLIYESSYN